MPLESGSSRAAMAKNYKKLQAEGKYSKKQIIAILLSKAGKARKKKAGST